jgi:hypothetical protein
MRKIHIVPTPLNRIVPTPLNRIVPTPLNRIVPTLQRGNAAGDAPASRNAERCANSQAPAWEFGLGSSGFPACEARASVTGFPSLSLGTSGFFKIHTVPALRVHIVPTLQRGNVPPATLQRRATRSVGTMHVLL